MNESHDAHRITEAQLRWAQFHFKRNAAHVRERVTVLYQTPQSPSQVEGYNEDTLSTASSDDSSNSSRPSISKGRRALLRVSKRNFKKRKEEASCRGRSFEEADDTVDDLAEIFAPVRRRRRKHSIRARQRRRHSSMHHQEDERIQRFEQAFRSMMETLSQQQQPQLPTIMTPTRKWTRPVVEEQEEQEYVDRKWGVLKRRTSNQTSWRHHNYNETESSWWTPAVTKYGDTSNSSNTQTNSEVEQQPHGGESTETTTTTTTTSPEFVQRRQRFENNNTPLQDRTGFVKNLVTQLEQSSQQFLTVDGKLHKAAFAQLVFSYLGHNNNQRRSMPWKSPVALARARQSAGSIAQRRWSIHQTTKQQQRTPPPSSIERFVQDLQENIPLRDDGRLNTEALEQYVTLYLAAAADASLQQQQKSGYVTPQGMMTSYTSFSSLRDVSSPRTEQLATPIMTNNRPKHESSHKPSPQNETPSSSPPSRQWAGRESLLSTASSAFGELRQMNRQTHRVQQEKVVEEEEVVSNDNDEVGEASEAEKKHTEEKKDAMVQEDLNESAFEEKKVADGSSEHTAESNYSLDSKVSAFANRFAGSVSSRVGGWMKRLQPQNDDNDTEAELRAVAEFRKARDGREDDSSSASSFRVLPDGIKKVVQDFAGRFQTDEATIDDSVLLESVQEDQALGASSFESMSSHRTTSTTSAGVALSPQRLKEFHSKMMEQSGETDQSIIDTDGNSSDYTAGERQIGNLLLSPTIISKRHQQAIRAIENRGWDQTFYLISANPWLAEMKDAKSEQFLLHKLAYYGAGEVDVDTETGEVVAIRHPVAPERINTDLIRMCSSAVHKFDQDGNLPLHFACAAGNLEMIRLLGDRFPGGAGVRNGDGMVPLHLAILACAAPISAYGDSIEVALETVKSILSYFPSAVGVTDDEGNLAIHTAANVLVGDVGVEIIFLLLDEAERQLMSESGVRFRNKSKLEDVKRALSEETESTATPTESGDHGDDDIMLQCTMVYNDKGQTPLTAAIHSRAGWEVIEAIACGPDGTLSARCCDSDKNTALHLLAGADYLDPEAIMSILKLAPEVASIRNNQGMLPIEVACMQDLPQDVVAAILLADLPFELNRKHDVEVLEGKGASWWYLACDCDDFYVDLVEELVQVCTLPQVQALCSLQGISGDPLIKRATPMARSILQSALRLEGRFELKSTDAISVDRTRGVKVFNALDFGEAASGETDGRPVLLKSYARPELFARQTRLLELDVNFALIEEAFAFRYDVDGTNQGLANVVGSRFIAMEQPNLTLQDVMEAMLRNEACQNDARIRQRYSSKVFSVLRVVAKALLHLHSLGFVHGNLNLRNCRRYEDKWKVADALDAQEIGRPVRISRLSSSCPPECIEPLSGGAKHEATFNVEYVCSPAMDSWGFGKSSYEALVGRSLVQLESGVRFEDDHRAMLDVLHWSSFNCDEVRQDLMKTGLPDSAARLISLCLSPDPAERPRIEEILSSDMWQDIRMK